MSEIVYAVGIGPGGTELLTRQAAAVLERCTAIAGYKLYLDQIPEFLTGKKVIPGAMRQEIMRCREALEAALEAAFDRENDPVRGADLARRLLFIVKFLQDARRASA